MKIVIPVIGFGTSGGYRVLSRLADEWIKLGHSVSFISTEWSIAPYFPTNAEVIWVNDIGESVIVERKRQLSGVIGVLRVLKSIFYGLKKHAIDADVIIANQNLTVWPVAFLRTFAKKIYYVQAYEPEYYHSNDFKSKILKFLSYLSYYVIDEKIVNSSIYLRYKNIRAEKVVPPGIDFNIFYPIHSAHENKTWIIGCVGRKEPEKGTKYVVDAFEKLSALGFPVKLHVAYGNVPDKILSRENCQIIIPKDDGGLGDFYRGLDIMIAPGTVQLGAAHYPVLEAMACGIPVITTGYIPADNTNSWIVPINDATSIVEAVKNIMAAPENVRSDKVKKANKDVQLFSWPIVAGKFINYIETSIR